MTRCPPFLALTLITPLLSACFLFQPATPAPTEPTPEEIAAQEAALEQERQRQIEQARTDFIANADAAKQAFEAERTLPNLGAYMGVLRRYEQLPEQSREGIDFNAHLEAVMVGTTAMLEPLTAEWAKKKNRTPDLEAQLKGVYGHRMKVLEIRQAQASEYLPEGATMLALGSLTDDWKIGMDSEGWDLALLFTVQQAGGRPVVHELCRTALDQAIADDKKDVARQHYIMQTCLYDSGNLSPSNWEEDLLAWATAKQASKQTKAFVEAYRPRHAELEAELARHQAERDAERARELEDFERRRAEEEAEIAAAQARAASSSSSSSGGGGPVTVTLRNTCGSTIKMFYGDDPEFGSGRTDSLGGNSRTTTQLKVGQMVWLTDASRNGISSVTVSESTDEIEFTCNGIRVH